MKGYIEDDIQQMKTERRKLAILRQNRLQA